MIGQNGHDVQAGCAIHAEEAASRHIGKTMQATLEKQCGGRMGKAMNIASEKAC